MTQRALEVVGSEGGVAYEALFRSTYPKLVIALSVAAGPEAAADALQDAFLQAHRHWAHVASLENPGGWVRRAAINRLANQQRGFRRRDAAVERLAVPVPPVELAPADLDLQRAIAALPTRQRLAVCLHYLGDLAVADVAAALDVSVGTVKSNLHDARLALRQRLGDPHDG